MAGTKALLAGLSFVKGVQPVVRQLCRGGWRGAVRKVEGEKEKTEKKAEGEESVRNRVEWSNNVL